jgi:hypothetical protein
MTIEANTRRDFLLAASLGGLGAVAVVAGAGMQCKLAVAAETGEPPAKAGYRASAHILQYYKTAQI